MRPNQDELFEVALSHHRAERWGSAEETYRRILEAEPENSDALHLLGVLFYQTGRNAEAIQSIERALATRPTAVYYLNLSNVLCTVGRLDEARSVLQQALERNPRDLVLVDRLATVLDLLGRPTEAIHTYRQALEWQPDSADLRYNLASTLHDQERLDEAIAEYEATLRLAPEHDRAHNNLGAVFHLREQYEAAAAEFEAAVRIDPTYHEAHNNLGAVLQEQCRYEEAVRCYRTAIELATDYTDPYRNLGLLLYHLKRYDEAAFVYRKWLELEPGNPIAAHLAASCSGENVPERAAVAYVRQEFDEFADGFERRLEKLRYRVPALIAQTLAGCFGEPQANLDVLDSGCGTGLCGPAIRPYARQLVGVDLSTRMLDHARQRDVYDELSDAELTAFMNSRARTFDLIVSADTFTYFGRLEPVFAAARVALRESGLLVFTVEHASDANKSYQLHPHGRYSHSAEYVRTALQARGLTIQSETVEILRHELGEPVDGLVVVAQK